MWTDNTTIDTQIGQFCKSNEYITSYVKPLQVCSLALSLISSVFCFITLRILVRYYQRTLRSIIHMNLLLAASVSSLISFLKLGLHFINMIVNRESVASVANSTLNRLYHYITYSTDFAEFDRFCDDGQGNTLSPHCYNTRQIKVSTTPINA